jgi:hypothetical protein
MLAATATACSAGAQALAACFSQVIVNPILGLIFAAGLLVFVWGIVEYIWGLSTKGENKNEGKQHMLWGLVGMFIMVAAYAILKVIVNTIGANGSVPLQ